VTPHIAQDGIYFGEVLRRTPDGSVAVHADVSEFGFGSETDPPANTPVPTSLTRVDPDGSVSRAASGLTWPRTGRIRVPGAGLP